MNRLLERAFGVRPAEVPLVTAFFVFFTGVGMFYTVGCTVGDTLFLSSLPRARVPAMLPLVYVGVAVANVAAALSFDALSARLPRRVLIVGVQVALALSVVGFRELLEAPTDWTYYALVIWMELCAVLSITLFFSFAGDYFSPRDARRLYGFIAGGMALGTMLSGSVIRHVVTHYGTKNLLWVGALLLLTNAAIALYIVRTGKPVVHESTHEAGEERAPLSAIFSRSYVRYLALVVPLAITLCVIADYQMKWAASAMSEQELARFFATFFTWVGVAQIVFQFVVVPRLLHRLGIIHCLMILPLALGVASAVLVGFSLSGFTAAMPLLFFSAGVNFLRMTISETLDIPSRELLFLPLPTRIRVRAQPLVVGALAPATQGVTGALLLGVFLLDVRIERLSLLVMLAAAILVLALVRLRPRYRETLTSTLREHQLDPTDLDQLLQNPSTQPVLADLLRSEDPEVARAALELIKDRELTGLTETLEALVKADLVTVAIPALKLLAKTRGEPAMRAIEHALDSGKRDLRQAAVLALCEVSGAAALPRVRESLMSNDRAVRNSAIIGLARHCGAEGLSLALPNIEERARSKRGADRMEAAELLGDIGAPGYAHLLAPLIDDPMLEARQAAAEACAKIIDPELQPLLLAKLGDASLQRIVLRALERTPEPAVAPLVALLDDVREPIKKRCMIARVLSRIGGPQAVKALLRTATSDDDITLRLAAANHLLWLRGQRGIEVRVVDFEGHIEALCERIDLGSRAFDEVGADDRFVGGAFREYADLHTELLLLLCAMQSDRTQVDRVRWNLFHDAAASGAHAVEVLEELLPRRVGPRVAAVITHWLETRTPRGHGMIPDTLRRLRGASTWIRAVTVYHQNRSPTLGDSQPLNITLAEAQLYQMLDMVSFLQRVPMFANLRSHALVEQAEICEWVDAPEGTAIFAQGDDGDSLYIVCAGHVRIIVNGAEVARLGPGECIGELSLLDDDPRSATAVLCADTRLLRISAERFKDLLLTQPVVAKAMLRTLDKRIRDTQASVKADAADEPPMRRSQMFRAQNLGLTELVSTMSFLQQVELFRDLDTPELANLAGIAQEVQLLEGDVLFKEGDVGASLYLVCAGSIAIRVGDREVARLSRGACLGEMALISGLPRSATATGVVAGKLLRIGSDDFTSLLEARPEIAIALLRTFAQRLRRASRQAK